MPGLIGLRIMLWLISLMLLSAGVVCAAVKGPCSNCHTMHNSQDGTPLTGSPNATLLISDCVGCHSSTGPDTIVSLGESRVPIVYNTTGYPAQPLAGGNFYHVADAGGNLDSHGHNVYGVSGEDEALMAGAPMDGYDTFCGTTSCHGSLAKPDYSPTSDVKGCQICHHDPKHHGSEVADGQLETADSGWYRFVGGHNDSYVNGIEDADWEQNPAAGHNRYYGKVRGPTAKSYLWAEHEMSAFCLSCHIMAHSSSSYDASNNTWLRHPVMNLLPNSGEFAGYDPVTSYDATVPVGWLNPRVPKRTEAVVMCLSCHRAHGSQYPDMLRWDYAAMTAGVGDSSDGCFKCHSTKDT